MPVEFLVIGIPPTVIAVVTIIVGVKCAFVSDKTYDLVLENYNATKRDLVESVSAYYSLTKELSESVRDVSQLTLEIKRILELEANGGSVKRVIKQKGRKQNV